jgi:hypothetical protein
MIPADLLDKLREKDPDLWEKIAETALSEYEYHDEEFNEWISNAITYTDLFEPAQEAWLQHCLQEAIRARGWRYGIDYDTDRVCATVLKNIDSAWKLIGVGYGSTEAEALMRAYLSALSGERI